jgi:predicted nucleotidyltransferase
LVLTLLVDLPIIGVYVGVVAAAVPTLVPLFRSEQQMRLLAEIYHGRRPASGAELARRLGTSQQTVARELARLEAAGLIVNEEIGTAKVARPAETLPYLEPLRQLLAYAGGILPALAEALGHFDDIDEAFVFGSWASRFHGDPGPPPNDIDVAVVSRTLSRFDLAEVRLDLEAGVGIPIDIVVVAPDHERLAELRTNAVPLALASR